MMRLFFFVFSWSVVEYRSRGRFWFNGNGDRIRRCIVGAAAIGYAGYQVLCGNGGRYRYLEWRGHDVVHGGGHAVGGVGDAPGRMAGEVHIKRCGLARTDRGHGIEGGGGNRIHHHFAYLEVHGATIAVGSYFKIVGSRRYPRHADRGAGGRACKEGVARRTISRVGGKVDPGDIFIQLPDVSIARDGYDTQLAGHARTHHVLRRSGSHSRQYRQKCQHQPEQYVSESFQIVIR